MVYTIENQCVEDSSIPYEDGARKIFLYTRGTEGNPSQELKDMLKYIEETTKANVTNQTIETIHNLVRQVKQKNISRNTGSIYYPKNRGDHTIVMTSPVFPFITLNHSQSSESGANV